MTGTAQGSDGSDTKFVIQLVLLVREEQVYAYTEHEFDFIILQSKLTLTVFDVEIILLAEELVFIQYVELLPSGQLLPDENYIKFN